MSTIDTKRVKDLLKTFEFQELFVEELGWERERGKHFVTVGEDLYEVAPVAEKKGLVAFMCQPSSSAPFPDSASRKKIEKEISSLHFEHLIIFIDQNKTRQTWQVPRREGGKTKGHSEIPYYAGKGVEHLARRVEQISFTLGETEEVSLLEVSARVNQALLAEKVTKKFFKQFNDQRQGFVKFLAWIEDEAKRDWYCSVLLNRLMFIYFLGGKGFLPDGTKFLAKSLQENIEKNGPDTFYTNFLLPLSFFGLGEKQGQRGRFEETFKDVLYLDGGLFAVHQVERELGLDKNSVDQGTCPDAARIPDDQFQKWFAYFDAWRWTLDEDKVENDGYISPHILGYIFEKYINQKQMGAYYTKEDITGYICRNTIIPRLFDMLAESGVKGQQAVHPLPIGPHPNLLNEGRGISEGEGIDRYVYPSVRQEAKLPTETDYELAQRRKRYEGILTDFDSGKIVGIDDFITYNLDIERLALDFVSNIQDPEVLHAFYFKGLQQITVLDPTCGSGAFLFAALNILYPLYNAALSRMEFLVSTATGIQPDVVNWAGRLHFDDLSIDQGTLVDFLPGPVAGSKVLHELRAEVERINEHPSAEYFIKKTIIVNNLYGVDIMEEAVEICKLRLFLTLIATVERDDTKDNFGIEPLPDIDFNILAGNTLVGYTSTTDIDRLWAEAEAKKITAKDGSINRQTGLMFEKDHSKLKTLIAEYRKVLGAWRLRQLGDEQGIEVTKEQVRNAVETVRPVLDRDLWYLYRSVGLSTKVSKQRNGTTSLSELTFEEFRSSHQPFHWLLEFPSIELSGGFDAVIGNPPFVELRKITEYSTFAFETIACNNLYPLIVERLTSISDNGRHGLIIPSAAFGATSTSILRQNLLSNSRTLHVSYFSADAHPSILFVGVKLRLAIYLANSRKFSSECHLFTSRYLRWYASERQTLFDSISYQLVPWQLTENLFPKLCNREELNIASKLQDQASLLKVLTNESEPCSILYYHNAPVFFVRAHNFEPLFSSETGNSESSSHLKTLKVSDENLAIVACMLSSSLFFFWFTNFSANRDLNKSDIDGFPVPGQINDQTKAILRRLFDELMLDIQQNSRLRTYNYKTGTVTYQEFYMRESKAIIDRIDQCLGSLYGLTNDEIALIKAYDLKYRMGNPSEEEN